MTCRRRAQPWPISIHPAFRPWASDDLERLRRSVDGYDYGEARGIASRLLARVHGGEA